MKAYTIHELYIHDLISESEHITLYIRGNCLLVTYDDIQNSDLIDESIICIKFKYNPFECTYDMVIVL